jgi:hypothetical protein
MMISSADAPMTVLMTTASSTKRIGKAMPFGGYNAPVFPANQIETPMLNSQALVYAAHSNLVRPLEPLQ